MLRRGSGSRFGSPGLGGTTMLLALLLLLHVPGLAVAEDAPAGDTPVAEPLKEFWMQRWKGRVFTAVTLCLFKMGS